MGMTQDLAGYCAALGYQNLPAEVIDCVKYRFLDFLSVAMRGSREQSSQTMYRFVKAIGPAGKGGVIVGTNLRAPYLYSALANGTASHAIEMDDVNNESSLHPGVAVFPAALATSEMVSNSGKSFIGSVVTGYEVMIRLGKALGPENSYRRGFHPTGTCGAFGAAMAASKVLGLGVEGITNAFGISGSQAAGSMEYLAQGAWTKRFHAGWAAHSGMVAALLAQKGFVGPTTILEGRDGFLHAYSDNADASKVLEGLGSGFEILRTSVKPHGCCRYMQPPIDAVLKIVNEKDLKPDQVERIRLGILRAGAGLIAEPMELKVRPQSTVDAQFSMPFGAAAALLFRRAGLNEFQVPVIQSEKTRRIMERVECVVDPELEKTFPRQWCATAEIWTKEGERFFTKVEYPKGDPENPLSWEEMIDRFHDLAGRSMVKKQRSSIVEQVRGLEGIKDIRKWASLFVRGK